MANRFFIFLLVFSSQVFSANDIEYSNTAERSVERQKTDQQRIEENAREFDVTTTEWTRYEGIMRGEGRFHWKNVDPIMVLGIYAKTTTQKTRYARLMAQKEHRLQSLFISFNQSYLNEFDKLYGDEPIIDLINFYANYQNKQLLSSVNSNALLPTPGNASTSNNKQNIGFGDHYVLFISAECTGCDSFYRQIKAEQSMGSVIDIYFVDNDKTAIGKWAKNMGIKPNDINNGHITLNLADKVYDRFNRPALPSAFYYNSEEDSMLSYKLD